MICIIDIQSDTPVTIIQVTVIHGDIHVVK